MTHPGNGKVKEPLLPPAKEPERLAPSSIDAEEALIGSVLINPDSFDDVAGIVTAADFFIVRNGWVWDAIVALRERGDAIDNLTVVQELKVRQRLDEVGGSAYITYLLNNTPTHVHADTYAQMVFRTAVRRRLLLAASQIAQAALDENETVDNLLAFAEDTLSVLKGRRDDDSLVGAGQAAVEYFDQVEYMYKHAGEYLGVPTRFADLDKAISGLQPGSLTIIGARPRMGKTAMMLNIALNAARQKVAVAVFSMEMPQRGVVNRFIASMTSLNHEHIARGALDEQGWSRFTEAIGEYGNLPIYIDDTSSQTITRLAMSIRRAVRKRNVRLVTVDYLQLMKGRPGAQNRDRELGEISRTLKELAMELDIPIIALAQLNRALEGRADKTPQLHDLRESGSIEADADVVLMLHRPDLYSENSGRNNECDIYVRKNRNGSPGMFTLYFNGPAMRFEQMRKIDVGGIWGESGRKGEEDD